MIRKQIAQSYVINEKQKPSGWITETGEWLPCSKCEHAKVARQHGMDEFQGEEIWARVCAGVVINGFGLTLLTDAQRYRLQLLGVGVPSEHANV